LKEEEEEEEEKVVNGLQLHVLLHVIPYNDILKFQQKNFISFLEAILHKQ
jgi:hypothetical protein